MLAEGQRLFFNETFNGNGRTCGTCHPAVNNFTIDPPFIATLNCADPLFVAEHAANPGACPGAAPQEPSLGDLEKPELMRQFALILENVDGLDDPTNKFVMRGVPHTLALTTSITSPPGFSPAQSTGWSGDGAPGSGSLREFAIGAVIQHFTKTLDRDEGPDFRLPTDDELDAMEAFQLAIGRQGDPNLSTLVLNGPVPSSGQNLFINGTGGGTCNACHFNAGANAAFLSPAGTRNANFNTNVEELVHPAQNVESFPCDGGLGTGSPPGTSSPCGPNLASTGFGDRTFNTPPLVEAADTGPFFHNNVITTIEDAVDFYNSAVFNNPRPAAAKISLNPTQVQAIAAFLRVLNALESIRFSIELDERALGALAMPNVIPLLQVSLAELGDAIQVLSDVGLHPDAVGLLIAARAHLQQGGGVTLNRNRISQSIDKQKAARGRLCQPGTDAMLCPPS
jgi:hypothetical protein